MTGDSLVRIASESPLFLLVAGLLLLVLGRKLYWLAVGVAGFALGYLLVERYVELDTAWLALALGLAAGLAAAVLAVLFQKIAVGLAGSLGGSLLLLALASELGWRERWWIWVVALAAGVVGFLLGRVIFEMALIVLTSLAGALLVVSAVPLGGGISALLFFALAVGGVLIQLLFFGRPRPRRRDA